VFCVVGQWETMNSSIVKISDWSIVQNTLIPSSDYLPKNFHFYDFIRGGIKLEDPIKILLSGICQMWLA
jgi:hypothetical protein